MPKDGSLKSRIMKQRYFTARELQFSIALLVVLALLAGIFLQAVSSALISYYGMATPALGIMLVIGYVGIVVILAVFFTYRLIGPFKRLEYEMKLIQSGNLMKRLSVRSQDDLHIKNFIIYPPFSEVPGRPPYQELHNLPELVPRQVRGDEQRVQPPEQRCHRKAR